MKTKLLGATTDELIPGPINKDELEILTRDILFTSLAERDDEAFINNLSSIIKLMDNDTSMYGATRGFIHFVIDRSIDIYEMLQHQYTEKVFLENELGVANGRINALEDKLKELCEMSHREGEHL